MDRADPLQHELLVVVHTLGERNYRSCKARPRDLERRTLPIVERFSMYIFGRCSISNGELKMSIGGSG
jgi:hypothetical protein